MRKAALGLFILVVAVTGYDPLHPAAPSSQPVSAAVAAGGDRLFALGKDLSPREFAKVQGPPISWTSPTGMAGITSSDPRVYPVSDLVVFATNDNNSESALGWGPGARSLDGGATWSVTPAPPGLASPNGIKHVVRDAAGRVWIIAHDDAGSGYTRAKIFYSDNSGDTWILADTFQGAFGIGEGQRLMTHPTNPNIIAMFGFGGYGEGFIRYSLDRGVSWNVFTNGVIRQGAGGGNNIYDAVMLPSNRIIIVGLFYPFGPFWRAAYSDDFGQTFSVGASEHHAGVTWNGLFRSRDGTRVAFYRTDGFTLDHTLYLSTNSGASYTQTPLSQELRDYVGGSFYLGGRFLGSPEQDAIYLATGQAKNVVRLSPVSAAGQWADLTSGYPHTSQGADNLGIVPPPPLQPRNVLGGRWSNRWGAFSYEPINLATGNYTYQHTDVQIPGKGYSLMFARSYNSQDDASSGRLGFGWQDNFRARLIFDNADHAIANVTVIGEEGRQDDYVRQSNGSYVAPTGVFNLLTRNPGDGSFDLVRPDQSRLRFDGNGLLQWTEDRNANRTTFTYSGTRLTAVTSPSGRTLTFGYDTSDRITSVTDPLGRVTSYSYSASGDLASVIVPGNAATSYGYDAAHQMLTITNPLGNLIVTNQYTSGKVTQQTDALSRTWAYTYNTFSTTETDARGCSTVYDYDAMFREVKRTDCLTGGTTTYTYDGLGNRDSVTNQLGNTSTFTYDANGNLLTSRDALNNTWTNTYNSFNDVLTEKDPRNNVTTYTYNAAGNITSVANASNQSTTFVPNPDGTLASTTDPLAHTTSFGYNADGLRTSVTNALSQTASHTYDAAGRLLTTTDAMGRTTTFAYDPRDNLLSVQDPLNGPSAKTEYTYDLADNRKTAKNPRGYITNYDYDVKGRLLKVTDPLARGTEYTYDENDNLKTLKDQKRQGTSRVVTYTYDLLNRRTKIAYPDIHYVTDYTYDAAGRRLTLTDTRGLCEPPPTGCALVNGASPTTTDMTTYTYDAVDRLTSVQTTFNGTKLVQYGYDAAGNRTSITYPDAKLATYTYDALNRMQTVSASWLLPPQVPRATYNYDAGGRLTQTGLRMGEFAAIPTTYGYDNADRLTSVTNTQPSPPLTLSFFNYAVNANGNRTQVTDASGLTSYNYDTLDRLTSVTYPGSPTSAYTYDGVGNRLTLSDPSTTYTYDAADQLSAINGVANTFDKNGSLLAIPVAGSFIPEGFVYDQENRLARTGRCRSDIDGNGTVSSYDQLILAERYTQVEGSMGYDQNVDIDGNGSINSQDLLILSSEYLTTLCTSSGPNTGNARHWYNGDGLRMRQRTHPAAGGLVNNDYVWDTASGLPVILQDTRTQGGVSTTTTFLYGLDLISETSGAGVTSYYLGDGLGSTVQLADSSGAVTDSYAYDVFGAPRSTAGSTANDFRFTGEQNDRNANRGLYYLRARHYDPGLGRFLSKDPLPQVNRYVYARNNPANLVDPLGFQESGRGGNPSERSWCSYGVAGGGSRLPDPAVIKDFFASPMSGTSNRYRACRKADNLAGEALMETGERYATCPGGVCAGRGHEVADAFRHCYWSALMTQSLGASTAKKIGDLHELDPLQNFAPAQRVADYHYNEVGRHLAGRYDSRVDLANACQTAAKP